MDLRKIKKLIELLEDSELSELEITEGDNTIRLNRTVQVQQFSSMPSGQTLPPVAAQPPAAPTTSHASATPTSTPVADTSSGTAVVSPLVGTFYDSPSPDDKPYVTVGSKVKVGDTLCLIEAMKTFNQVESEIAGVVSAINKNNGDPVEYGEPIFVIDASA